jgi:hypothetical protein
MLAVSYERRVYRVSEDGTVEVPGAARAELEEHGSRAAALRSALGHATRGFSRPFRERVREAR